MDRDAGAGAKLGDAPLQAVKDVDSTVIADIDCFGIEPLSRAAAVTSDSRDDSTKGIDHERRPRLSVEDPHSRA